MNTTHKWSVHIIISIQISALPKMVGSWIKKLAAFPRKDSEWWLVSSDENAGNDMEKNYVMERLLGYFGVIHWTCVSVYTQNIQKYEIVDAQVYGSNT